ncbi:MAG: alpha/beta hydrolase [Nonomuraea sp.]|nr:alpha/beta hydrolase [Nonomuraea sp.]
MVGMNFTIEHDNVKIPVSRGGHGRPLVLCPGLNTTQADLGELVELLRQDHDVVTFDLRGHGLASASDRYTFEAFLGDLDAVMEHLDLDVPPLLVGYSMGADLVVHHASEHPGGVAGLVLIDGANPVPEPFVTDDLAPLLRAMWEAAEPGSLLSVQEIFDLNVEIDEVRSAILDRYAKIDAPIRTIMSTSMAGDAAAEHARRLNANWRAGAERLAREHPRIATSWIDADHGLVFTHAPEIARIIRAC